MSANLRPPLRARGVTLIELMVGLVLGLVVVLFASSIFIGTRQATRTTDGLSRAQETARNAFELMARDLRETGGNPCDNLLTVTNVLNSAQAVPPSWWVDWARQLQGFEPANAFEGAAIGAAVGQRVAGTDAVMSKYVADLNDLTVTAHATAPAVFNVNNNPHRARAGDLLMVCNYGQGALFQASSVTATTIEHAESAAVDGNCSRGLGVPTVCVAVGTTYSYSPGSKIGRLVAVGWYIGNNGRPDSGGTSLFRVTRNGAEEVAEGVSDLQIQYLVTGGAGYVDATAVPDWNNVLGMRVTLTLRGADRGTSTTADTRLQRPMSFTLHLRNRQP